MHSSRSRFPVSRRLQRSGCKRHSINTNPLGLQNSTLPRRPTSLPRRNPKNRLAGRANRSDGSDKVPLAQAWWLNSLEGSTSAIGTFESMGEKSFSPPAPGELLDRVLVLDDAGKAYPPPGTVTAQP
ncbi:MAG: hypothetical protein FJ302_04320 [Planctomycetes bacterium]|nr:hypothetical protein [Planctomycetota bacterium]